MKAKLTPAQKKQKSKHKAEQRRLYEWVMINGKQKKVRRTPEYDRFADCESWADVGVEMEIWKMERYFEAFPDAEEYDYQWDEDALPC